MWIIESVMLTVYKISNYLNCRRAIYDLFKWNIIHLNTNDSDNKFIERRFYRYHLCSNVFLMKYNPPKQVCVHHYINMYFHRANQCPWLPVSYQFCNFLVLAVGVGAIVASSNSQLAELVGIESIYYILCTIKRLFNT